MENKLTAEVSADINAPASKVWEAITTPATIKQYLFGTNVITDWKVGSPIEYKGEFNGKAYHDKGVIKKLESEKVFESTYWSSMGGLEDKPENYYLVTYTLKENNGKTQVTITQANIRDEQTKNHTTENWKMVLGKLKEIVEK